MPNYDTVADEATIAKTKEALETNGFKVTIVENGEAAKAAALGLIPKGAEVMTMTSKTLQTIGLDAALNEPGEYDAVRVKLNALYGDSSKKREARKLGTAPDYAVGSIHAVTQDGHVLVASATGSQLPAYVYGAGEVIWVVGAQKIVANLGEASDRLRAHVFPLEDARSQEAYGMNSSINYELFYYKSPSDRVTIILVKEALGF
jgi:hypothetical protein